MEQGSNDWHKWREEGLGSSDIPVVMEAEGCYSTRHKLWLKKTGQAPPETEKEKKSKEFIFEKGHRIEEMVRERYERKELICFKAALFQRADRPWQKASVDLCSHETKTIKEVKYVSLEEFEAGLCPARYYDQIQWQYYVTGFVCVDLVLATDYMWNEDKTEKIKIPTKEGFRTKEVQVAVDLDRIQKCHDESVIFWEHHVLKKIPPALSDRDAVPLKDKSVQALLREYASIEKKLKKLDPLEKRKKEIIDLVFAHEAVRHPIMSWKNMKVTLTPRKGSIDYKKIPEVKELSEEYLEKFRGKETVARSIKC